ncbi:hypothetical protein JRO89_XS01G0028100 [Xanthoceras sorbifolium]|uniref:Uncharacterized protein n=1 Tax=Xanthoceras sorbifolium TaxID=99658 RepID=A0ABQ8IHY4_9ROSI|nr:hypothetical protein JRO89_XS01G0028100 [Xanthoceras sorbifolium]
MRLPERNHDDEVIRELLMDTKRPVRKFRVMRRAAVAIKASNKMRPNMKKISCQQSHFHHNLESRHHFVFIHVIPLLIGLLQVDYQSKNASPFDTHPINMWIFFAATAIYCLGLSIKMDSQNHQSTYSQIITGHFILCSGALSSVSLASIFLPRLLGWRMSLPSGEKELHLERRRVGSRNMDGIGSHKVFWLDLSWIILLDHLDYTYLVVGFGSWVRKRYPE